MNRKILGTLGLMGAPFLGAGMYLDATHHPLSGTWLIDISGLLYISGWMASIQGFRQLEATGSSRFGKRLLRIVLLTLSLANVYNVWELIDPASTSPFYFIVDMCWPLSNVLMAAVGVAVLRAGRLRGWQRWVPLAMSFWLPLALLLSKQFGFTPTILLITGAYSALTWSLLAITVITAPAALMSTSRQPAN